ncbi:MAG TPA: Hsp20/alpha crystallin family protein [Nannocystaceae bacterium]|nr:Hsp20/alpha crystallin family protein [Nannocystaceae bacterium]
MSRDPFGQMRDLLRQMDEVFSGVDAPLLGGGAEMWPAVECHDDGDELVFRADLPGLTEKDVTIEATGRSLTIRGEKKVEPPKGYTPHRTERQSLRFARSFSLPAAIDLEAVAASVKNGVLTVTAKKIPEARPRQISVKSA